jgi:hypothetical protein
MVSKYDAYWAGRLEDLRAAIVRAAGGASTVVNLPGLVGGGDRRSWSGVAEVRGRDLTRSSMAHATSLGKMVAASGQCAAWPETTFRFAVSAAGDVLAVSAAMSRKPVDAVLSGGREAAVAFKSAPSGRPDMTFRAGQGGGAVSAGVAASRFYGLLGQLSEIVGGPRCLRDCDGADRWPRQGVYFFFEPGEARADGSDRVVRVGTHALTTTSQATLWGRLRQHRGGVSGSRPGGGNHRASVFRRHVGAALIRRAGPPGELLDSWLDRHGPRPGSQEAEDRVELDVSRHIGGMPFLWLSVPDRAQRGFVERNSIALTSCLADGLDQPSAGWLGRDANRPEIRQSGLWNVEHIRHRTEPGFADLFSQLMQQHR